MPILSKRGTPEGFRGPLDRWVTRRKLDTDGTSSTGPDKLATAPAPVPHRRATAAAVAAAGPGERVVIDSPVVGSLVTSNSLAAVASGPRNEEGGLAAASSGLAAADSGPAAGPAGGELGSAQVARALASGLPDVLRAASETPGGARVALQCSPAGD
eukprot:1594281-Prymnesium_polylepis.2